MIHSCNEKGATVMILERQQHTLTSPMSQQRFHGQKSVQNILYGPGDVAAGANRQLLVREALYTHKGQAFCH